MLLASLFLMRCHWIKLNGKINTETVGGMGTVATFSTNSSVALCMAGLSCDCEHAASRINLCAAPAFNFPARKVSVISLLMTRNGVWDKSSAPHSSAYRKRVSKFKPLNARTCCWVRRCADPTCSLRRRPIQLGPRPTPSPQTATWPSSGLWARPFGPAPAFRRTDPPVLGSFSRDATSAGHLWPRALLSGREKGRMGCR